MSMTTKSIPFGETRKEQQQQKTANRRQNNRSLMETFVQIHFLSLSLFIRLLFVFLSATNLCNMNKVIKHKTSFVIIHFKSTFC